MRVVPAARAVAALAPAMLAIQDCPAEAEAARRAAARGWFTPHEDDVVRAWFARYLTARAALLEVIAELRRDAARDLRAFAVAHAAACLAVRAARYLVDEFAADPVVRRKLDEPEPRHRIPRKRCAAIHRSLTSPLNAWRLWNARERARLLDAELEALAADPELSPVVEVLRRARRSLDVHPLVYARARLRYRRLALRRRCVSALQRAAFRASEAAGRLVADLRSPFHRPRLRRRVRKRIEAMLRPGDVLVTRRKRVLSNLFLPGWWPHASLYLGPPAEVRGMGVFVSPERAARWVEPLRVLEARKDGVRFRALADTLGVDAVAVIRPLLGPEAIAEALTEAITHEGKAYNFDFDFFTSDRLVCTEVVYRAYDGAGGGAITISLTERAGRPTLSAEDLLDLAVAGRGFDVVAVCGGPGRRRRLLSGPDARAALAAGRGPDAGPDRGPK
jgi:hypothetical protein